MIEQALESAAIAAFKSLELPGLVVSGFWQPAESGIVKDKEPADVTATLQVVAGTRQFETFSSPKVSVTLAIVLAVAQDRAPDGQALVQLASPIADKLQVWQDDLAAVKTLFTVPGFNPSGAQVTGGRPAFAPTTRVWSVPYSLTLRGVYVRGA